MPPIPDIPPNKQENLRDSLIKKILEKIAITLPGLSNQDIEREVLAVMEEEQIRTNEGENIFFALKGQIESRLREKRDASKIDISHPIHKSDARAHELRNTLPEDD